MEETFTHLHIQDWPFLWTEYEYRRKPMPKTGTNFNGHLIQTYGATFKYCLNQNSSRLLKKLFQENLIATAEKKVDRNCHPIGLATGAPGVGKTRFLLECVNHLREKYPEFLKNLVDVVVISYNNGNLPSDLDKQLDVEKSLSLRLLHATFVDPIRGFDDFANDLKKAEIDINITFKFALTIVRKGLGIQLTDNWLIVIAIDEFNKILTHFENDTGRRFLSKLSQILGSVMCNPPEHTTVVGLMAGTMVVAINSIFRESSHDRISMCLSPLNIYERTEILLALDRFPPEWRTCREFRVSLADVGGLPRLLEAFILKCQEYVNNEVLIKNWPYKDEIMPAVKQYAKSHYLAGARQFTVKLIEDTILQTPVNREDVIDSTGGTTTYGDLITTYSANSISELTNDKVQDIIDNFSEHNDNDNTDVEEVSSHMTEISAGGPGQNSSDDSKEVSPNNSLEAVDDYKILLEECAKDCEYFDKEIDSTSQSVKETNEEVASQSGEESNESKSDNENDSSDSEEEMPDDLDDDGYGGYNEYGECDRGYYCRDGRYERKTSPMMSPIISPVTA
ncbi:hypothetical protein RhiirA4_463605 [Rhizophagus irregularis]|uniref:Crinkler family protein n=1 Tax=Rhizophagus irregularis TaxID=588596 RepID=A0A2I1GNK0_9GLOM|nr:hypothetical protein RhiirA4_463605 [Rhizophagus irregularis]